MSTEGAKTLDERPTVPQQDASLPARAPRYPVRFRVLYDAEGYSLANVVDISQTGLLMETADPLPIGTTVQFVPDGDGPLSEISGRVVRVHRPDDPMEASITKVNYGLCSIGVAFVDVDPGMANALSEIVQQALKQHNA